MAEDIIDIVHRISYEVKGKQSLENVEKFFSQNAMAIGENMKAIEKLKALMKETDDQATKNNIAKSIEARTKAIAREEAAIKNIILTNKAYHASLQQELGLMGSLESRAKSLRSAMVMAQTPASYAKYNSQLQQVQKEYNRTSGLTMDSKGGVVSSLTQNIMKGFGADMGAGVMDMVQKITYEAQIDQSIEKVKHLFEDNAIAIGRNIAVLGELKTQLEQTGDPDERDGIQKLIDGRIKAIEAEKKAIQETIINNKEYHAILQDEIGLIASLEARAKALQTAMANSPDTKTFLENRGKYEKIQEKQDRIAGLTLDESGGIISKVTGGIMQGLADGKAEMYDMVQKITFDINGADRLERIKDIFKDNATEIGKNIAEIGLLKEKLDESADPTEQAKLRQEIQARSAVIEKETHLIQDKILNSKEYHTLLQEELGILGSLEVRARAYQAAMTSSKTREEYLGNQQGLEKIQERKNRLAGLTLDDQGSITSRAAKDIITGINKDAGAGVMDMVQRITYEVKGTEGISNVAYLFEGNVKAIGKNMAAISELKDKLDETSDVGEQTKIRAEIEKRTQAIEAESKAIKDTVINSEEYHQKLTEEVGLINAIEIQVKNLEQARKSANTGDEIDEYTEKIRILKEEYDGLIKKQVETPIAPPAINLANQTKDSILSGAASGRVNDVIQKISYEISGGENVEKIKSLFQENATEIGKNVASLNRLQKQLDATSDPAKQSRLRSAMDNRVRAIEKEKSAIQQTIITNKEYHNALKNEVGIINALEIRLQALQDARRKATDPKEIKQYNNQIEAIQKEQSNLMGGKKGGILGQIGGGIMQGLGIGAGLGVAGLIAGGIQKITGAVKDFAVASFNAAADIEQFRVAFTTMTGSLRTADELIESLQNFAMVTPYGTIQLIELSKQLMGYGVTAKEIIPTIDMLGNVASGVGIEKMPYLVQAFGQIKAAGRLLGQELLQLVNTGFNPLQIMSEQTGKSMAQLRKEMGEGKITFKEIENAFKTATSEGGRFFNLMQNQSQTTKGRLDALSDATQKLQISIGDRLTPVIKGATNALIDMTLASNSYIETNYEEKVRAEYLETKSLAIQIANAAEGTKIRKNLIVEINQKYPDFLANLDAEYVKTEEVNSAIRRGVGLYRQKLSLMGKEANLRLIEEKRDKSQDFMQNLSSIGGFIAAREPNSPLAKYAGRGEEFAEYLSTLSESQYKQLYKKNPLFQEALVDMRRKNPTFFSSLDEMVGNYKDMAESASREIFQGVLPAIQSMKQASAEMENALADTDEERKKYSKAEYTNSTITNRTAYFRLDKDKKRIEEEIKGLEKEGKDTRERVKEIAKIQINLDRLNKEQTRLTNDYLGIIPELPPYEEEKKGGATRAGAKPPDPDVAARKALKDTLRTAETNWRTDNEYMKRITELKNERSEAAKTYLNIMESPLYGDLQTSDRDALQRIYSESYKRSEEDQKLIQSQDDKYRLDIENALLGTLVNIPIMTPNVREEIESRMQQNLIKTEALEVDISSIQIKIKLDRDPKIDLDRSMEDSLYRATENARKRVQNIFDRERDLAEKINDWGRERAKKSAKEGYNNTMWNRKQRRAFTEGDASILDEESGFEKRVKEAEEVSNAIIDIARKELEAKMRLIDREIEYRERKMTKAKELAEMGNVDALKREEKRLDELYKKREDMANKELAINQLLTLSELAKASAMMYTTIANIGSKSDPWTAAFNIAASGAAIVASILSIKNAMSTINSGYYTGGYTGDGGKYEVAGDVHKGEFVFDQGVTGKWRPLFEEIHNKKLTPSEFLSSRNVGTSKLATSYDTRGEVFAIKEELVAVKDAINNISVNANQTMNEYGLSQRIEFVKRKDRNRFR